MADNLTAQSTTPATIPASTVIATDDVGGAHYQRMKLDVGGDGASSPVTSIASETTLAAQSTLMGAVTETAPASDTASSGANGRLQRIAQRITSLIALLPASLGQKTMAASFAVVLASDQAAIPVTGAAASNAGSASIAAAQVTVTNTSAQIVAARATRRAVTITNITGTIDTWYGAGTVTASNGALLPGIKGASITINTVAAINGITTSSTQVVSYLEEYD